MAQLNFFARILVVLTLSSTQLVHAKSDPVYDAFESYKKCIKAIKKEGKQTVSTENYKDFCKSELNHLKEIAPNSFPQIDKVIQSWLSRK
ncbi:hypothetical protein [Pseudoalteromonas sp. T1lg21]|uniref:hypothetical protein n=1 Tax=Pseudoalteromonas sp. T1lg21 TaxID=2077095 RepID=UPI000CF623BD|nr:hypothetical protein [Pseudoalteromonas sp. T1lg21]